MKNMMEKTVLYPRNVDREKIAVLEQKDVELIENLPISVQEKIEILLVKARTKPASDITFYSKEWGQFERDKKVDKRKIDSVIDGFEKLELPYNLKKNEGKDTIIKRDKRQREVPYERRKVSIFFGKDQESLSMLINADDDRSMGEAYGFPKTAVDAYLGEREIIERRNLPRWIRQLDFFPFVTFGTLSFDNWMNEIKVAEIWALTVKRNSPKLYDEYIKDIRKKVSKF